MKYSDNPLVETYEDFLSEEECQHFIDISKDDLKRALVSDNSNGYISKGRTGSNTWIKHDFDDITKSVGERISKIVGIPLENVESYQIIHYDKTQEYKNHYDSWEHNESEKTLRCMKYGGARLMTALCYLNTVKNGGGTKMTKLDITISSEQGKMLVFQNTISKDDHTRHPLSEHAGLPVEEGEKYAFNLWFRECPRNILYEDFNPDYYKNNINTVNENDTSDKNENDTSDINETIISGKNIYKYNNILDDNDIKTIMNLCKFNNNNNNKRKTTWICKNKISTIINKLESIIDFNKNNLSNMNIVEYKSNEIHNSHYNAYDLNTERGIDLSKKSGQRKYTFIIPLISDINIRYDKLNKNVKLNNKDLLYQLETKGINRDPELSKLIINKNNITNYVGYMYIYETVDVNKYIKNNDTYNIKNNENYINTLNKVFDMFKNNEIDEKWNGYNSFKYLFKGDIDIFKNTINNYNDIRSNYKVLNNVNLEKEYNLNSELPLQIVNNVLHEDLLYLLQKYYKETIENNTWSLGDRQSKRYKSHNEPMSRFIHYEILPLIEKIVGGKLYPTYTYLSAYVKGSDLPAHTDRPDCEYTVSFIIDKPKDSNWNIYVHKLKQPIKHQGRSLITPPKEECEAVDCDVGGLMLFQGIDHIHYREKSEYDYYNILLLHYCCI